MRELERAAKTQNLDVERFLGVPQVLHSIELTQIEVLDLTGAETRDRLGLEASDLVGAHGPCQEVGHAAWFLEFHGVLAPSAVGDGLTLALFEHSTPPSAISARSTQSLDYDLYMSLVDQ